MSWDTDATLMLREAIGDTTDTPLYDDTRLKNILMVAAQLNQADGFPFSQNFVVDLNAQVVTPDPGGQGGVARDNVFINLAVLRAAALVARAEFRTAASLGIAVRDGTNQYDGKALIQAKKDLMQTYQGFFERAAFEYRIYNRTPGVAVMGATATPLYFGWDYRSHYFSGPSIA